MLCTTTAQWLAACVEACHCCVLPGTANFGLSLVLHACQSPEHQGVLCRGSGHCMAGFLGPRHRMTSGSLTLEQSTGVRSLCKAPRHCRATSTWPALQRQHPF